MRIKLLATALILSAAISHTSPSIAQMSTEKQAFAQVMNIWVSRAAMMDVCGKGSTSAKLSGITTQYLTKVLGWPRPVAAKRVQSSKQTFLRLYRGWKSGTNERQRRIYQLLFNAESCKHMERLSNFDFGFLRGALRRLNR